MLQPYLCIGNVEIAHPTRTLTYLANLGHGYLGSAPDPNCGNCFGVGVIPPPPPPPPGLGITNTFLPGAVIGTPYSVQMNAVNAAGPLSWSATGLPPNLTINPTTGVISGNATTVGTYSPTVFVTDGVTTAQRIYSLTVTTTPPAGGCEVPYALSAGFERSVAGQLGTMIWDMFRGAQTVTRIGVHRETRITNTTSRPAVPTTGWVASDYADPFTLPLLLNVDTAGNCAAGSARFERWHLYDIEVWPVPHTSPPVPGEAPGHVSVLFYIEPCAVGSGYGNCGVSFDDGLTWANIATGTTPGRASGSARMGIECVPNDPIQFRVTKTGTNATTFAHRFEYLSGGSGNFDVEVWHAPVGAYAEAPPLLPFMSGESSPWLLGNLGQLTEGVMTVHFETGVVSPWGNNVGGYYQWWRYTDRVTRASLDMVWAVQGPSIPSTITSWAGQVAYSVDGGRTWVTPSMGPTTATVTPVLRRAKVATVPTAAPAAPAAAVMSAESSEETMFAAVAAALAPDVEQPFMDPVTDLAPWYDPAIPESADVLGVWIEEFRSPVPYGRDMKDKRWGGTLSPAKMPSRELLLTGYVYAKSCEATEYAKRWLFEALAQESCSGCDLPDAIVFRGCDPATKSAQHARTIRRVGLIDYDPEIEPDFPCCLGFKFEATLRAEVPYMYRDPITVYDGPIVNMAQEPVCNICAPCPTITAMPACGCMDVLEPHVDQRSLSECYCSPARARRICVPIQSPGQLWNDGTLRLTLRAGPPIDHMDADGNHIQAAEGLRNLRIVAYPNPMGLESGDMNGVDFFACQEPCVSVEVSCLPATAELVVDGTSRRSKVVMGPAEDNGWGYLSSGGGGRFMWPDVGCNGLMLCIETDSVWIEDGGSLKVEMVPRERA